MVYRIKGVHNVEFITKGHEDLELSTQILIKEAVMRGIEVEVLDRKDNFIRLKKDGKTEYIKQATRTSADSYIAHLIMENKVVTKHILHEQGLCTPQGKTFDTIDLALTAYHEFSNIDLVVKPKSTNFGIGITILKKAEPETDYIQAVNEAFKFDKSIIIEEFIPGKEYRFLIIGEEVVGVLHRVPANVIGDGKNTIKELINIKNESPLRGVGYKRPLEKIKMGEMEKSFLHLQGKDFDHIPEADEQVFLRKKFQYQYRWR